MADDSLGTDRGRELRKEIRTEAPMKCRLRIRVGPGLVIKMHADVV